jgi:DNA-binding TFAR19-related protein (PDSD5 family)
MSDDFELERIRMEKMKALMKAQEMKRLQEERQKRQPTLTEKIEALLNVILEPQALQYLTMMKNSRNEVYQKVIVNLLPPEIISEIDTLMQYLASGLIRRGVVSLIDVQFTERKVLGIESQIVVKKRDHEVQSLTSYLKEEPSQKKK